MRVQLRILVTGCAGFIGSFVSRRLLSRGDVVIGVDNVNTYYDVALKEARLKQLAEFPDFSFHRVDCADRVRMAELFVTERFDLVVHLAAQAGVRHSLEHPFDYTDSNITGFLAILEGCRHGKVRHLVYASSASVYGLNTAMPWSIHEGVNHPMTLYGATKKANELMAHAYSHLFAVPTTGLRFFSVYGPWGRPDMALFKFTENILAGKPIDVYNHGKMKRDWTYVDDIVEGVVRVLDRVPSGDPAFDTALPDPAISSAPYRIYNIGNCAPVELMHFVRAIETSLGREALINYLPIQAGDIPASQADVSDLERDTGFRPTTTIEAGVASFVSWYLGYYGRR